MGPIRRFPVLRMGLEVLTMVKGEMKEIRP